VNKLIVTVKEDFHESRKYDMKTNVLDISFLDEMATRPWFVMYNLFNSSAATSLVVM
jgi:hypothetical protein